MSCDGRHDLITAPPQPAIEDVLLGAIPGPAEGQPHNKVLSPTARAGEEYMKPFRAAAEGTLGTRTCS
jgi:hypothetical protein